MNGQFLGSRYKVVKPLSKGGFGTTYLAEDTQYPNNLLCVVKKLHSAVDNKNAEFLTIARRLFDQEAQTLAKLGKHDRIPQLLAYFEEDCEFYLVQEFVEGETLSHELTNNQIWSEAKVVNFLQDMLEVVDFVHQNEVIHRDIKPDNLIRRNFDNKIVLVDFGTAKEVIQAQTEAIALTVSVGTRGYMPTEQARGRPRYASDIYAVGMIAIQALTGTHPLELPEDGNGELLWQDRAKCDPELAQTISKMIRYHFKERYQSASEILSVLNPSPPDSDRATNTINSASENQTDIGQKSPWLKTAGIALAGLTLVGGSIVGGKYLFTNATEKETAAELTLAQQAAQAGDYGEAIELAQALPTSTNIQQQIDNWSKQLLSQAQAKYTQKGEIATATMIIEQIIPETSPTKKLGQKLLSGWQKEHEFNQSILNVAKEELQKERWQAAKQEAAKITGETAYWKNQAQTVVKAADLGMESQPGVMDLCSKALDLCN